jgi:hypothetical protein
MLIHSIEKGYRSPELRPLYPVFDECRRIDKGKGQIVNVSWVARSLQSALNKGLNGDEINCAIVPARELIKTMDPGEVDKYRTYAAQLSMYDCKEPLIVLRRGRLRLHKFDYNTCEILNGKARVVRAEARGISLPVIIISRARARLWGMPPWARGLGTGSPLPVLSRGKQGGSKQRRHKCRSGSNTLPPAPIIGTDGQLVEKSRPVVSKRTINARAGTVSGRVTHPTTFGLVLLSDCGVRAKARWMLTLRNQAPRGLINGFSEPTISGPTTARYHETCLLILFAKLLKALRDDVRASENKSYDDFRFLRDWEGTKPHRKLMRELLRRPLDVKSLECPHEKQIVDDELCGLASRARTAFAKAGPNWHSPLSERLLLLSATRDPPSVMGLEKKCVLRHHYLDLLDWTVRALFRAGHWRIGCNSIERLDTHGQFHKAHEYDATSEISPVKRISHEATGSARFQALTDLDIKPLLILAMHARFNPFLIWHDMRWAVPLGHWAMAIADLDAGRDTHVTTWMAELYEEQRRRRFKHQNHFTGPATMLVHWLHWVCGDVADFSSELAETCELVVSEFPERSGRLLRIEVDQDGVRTLISDRLSYQEDWALQATLFA